MHYIYRDYQIDIGTTERRDGSVATEACIALDYHPIHSVLTFYGQETLALEQALRWIGEQEGEVR